MTTPPIEDSIEELKQTVFWSQDKKRKEEALLALIESEKERTLPDYYVKIKGVDSMDVFEGKDAFDFFIGTMTVNREREARIDENKRWQQLLLDREAIHSYTKINVIDYEKRIEYLQTKEPKEDI